MLPLQGLGQVYFRAKFIGIYYSHIVILKQPKNKVFAWSMEPRFDTAANGPPQGALCAQSFLPNLKDII